MNALYIVLPLALLLASSAVLAFAWVVRSGQLDDVDTPPRRILFDSDRHTETPRDLRDGREQAQALPDARRQTA